MMVISKILSNLQTVIVKIQQVKEFVVEVLPPLFILGVN